METAGLWESLGSLGLVTRPQRLQWLESGHGVEGLAEAVVLKPASPLSPGCGRERFVLWQTSVA